MTDYSQPNHDTEDKAWWVEKGASDELDFIQHIAPQIPLDARPNPQKAHDPFAHDLYVGDSRAELKHQTTPFFTAGVKYAFEPRFTVTFNKKDLHRYHETYPALQVYYWVNWEQTELHLHGTRYNVLPLHGVWLAPLPSIIDSLQARQPPLHPYKRRVDDDKGNAKSSYLLDLRWFDCLWLDPSRPDNPNLSQLHNS